MLIIHFAFDFCSEHFEEKQKRLQEYYDQRSVENTHLHQHNEQLKRQIQELQDQVSANEAQNQQSYEQLQLEVQKLQKENKELDVALQEYRKECESLMSDYRASADRLRETEADRDKYKNQYDTALRELAQRAERIKQLEQQRKEATERSEHMSFQVSRLHAALPLSFQASHVSRPSHWTVEKTWERGYCRVCSAKIYCSLSGSLSPS